MLYTNNMEHYESLILHWVNRLSFLSRRELSERFKQAGHKISPEEWAVLLMLWQEDGQGPGSISARSLRDATTVTRLIDAMVRKSLVERRESRSDRRRSEIWLTETGRGLQSVLPSLARPLIDTASDGISALDHETALRVLQQMAANLVGTTATQGEENARSV